MLLTSGEAQTAPPFIPTIIGEGGMDWPAVGAGTTLFLIPHSRLHRTAAQASAARHHLRRGAQMKNFIATPCQLSPGPLGNLATVVIAAGVLMLLQPLSMTLYTYSFITTLIGTVMFIVVTKFPE